MISTLQLKKQSSIKILFKDDKVAIVSISSFPSVIFRLEVVDDININVINIFPLITPISICKDIALNDGMIESKRLLIISNNLSFKRFMNSIGPYNISVTKYQQPNSSFSSSIGIDHLVINNEYDINNKLPFRNTRRDSFPTTLSRSGYASRDALYGRKEQHE